MLFHLQFPFTNGLHSPQWIHPQSIVSEIFFFYDWHCCHTRQINLEFKNFYSVFEFYHKNVMIEFMVNLAINFTTKLTISQVRIGFVFRTEKQYCFIIIYGKRISYGTIKKIITRKSYNSLQIVKYIGRVMLYFAQSPFLHYLTFFALSAVHTSSLSPMLFIFCKEIPPSSPPPHTLSLVYV